MDAARRMLDGIPTPIAALGDGSGRFVMRDSTVAAFFHEDGFALSILEASAAKEDAHAGEEQERRAWGLHWKLVGANATRFAPVEELATRFHHFTGDEDQWDTDVRTYGGVAWDELYPGIAMRVQAEAHGFEYRFLVEPGADARAIQIEHAGVDALRVVDGGRALALETGLGVVREEGLRCFQEAGDGPIDVSCRFALRSATTVGIDIEGRLDPALPLVIDPTVSWSSYLGASISGASTDCRGVAVDASGNVYLTGTTLASLSFPTTGGFKTAISSTQDAFVTKVNAAGSSLAWSSYFGGSSTDTGAAIAVDASGNVYLTGTTSSGTFTTTGGFQTLLGGTQDAFVAKIDASGSVITWSSYLGGSGSETATGVAVDANGDVLVTGSTSSSDFPSAGLGFQPALAGGNDVFIAKVSAAGSSLAWSSYLGGTSTEVGSGVAVDTSGSIVVTGHTASSADFPASVGSYQSAYVGGSNDVFVAKIDTAGSVLTWATLLGGTGNDQAFGLALDGSGNAFVTGTTNSPDFPSSGGFQAAFSGSNDAFVTKVNADGTSLGWSSYLGGLGTDIAYAITVDDSGDVYVTGSTTSSGVTFPTTGGFQTALSGNQDAFVTKVTAAGSSLAWSSFLGGTASDTGYAIAVGSSGDVYVAGATQSTSGFPASGGFQTTRVGSQDGFVTKVNAAGSSIAWSSYLGGLARNATNVLRAVAVDASGYVYVTGEMNGFDYPATAGFQASSGGSYDAIVAKLSPSGTALVWSSHLGGMGNDYGYGIAVDASGNAYVTGTTQSATGFPTTGGFDATLSGTQDAFVARVNAAGNTLDWSSYLGGTGSESGNGIAVDASGNAYVTGFTTSSGFPSSGGFDTTLSGSQDAFVTKINAAGSSLAWSSFLGGSSSETGQGIAVDSAGNAYVTGSTLSSSGIATGGFQPSLNGSQDAFVTKVDAAGSTLAWSSYLGGSGSEIGFGIAIDASRNVYVTGRTTSSSGFPTTGGFQTTYGGAQDAFVAKVNAAGSSLAWGSYLGHSGLDDAYAIALDAHANVFVTGTTQSWTGFATAGALDTTLGGSRDAFITKVRAVGSSLAWTSYLGGGGSTEYGYGIAVQSGKIYVVGTTSSTNFPVTAGVVTTSLPGSTGGFITTYAELPIASACTAHSDCESAYCADGVCCDSGCSDGCGVCNQAGSVGTCVPRSVGHAGSPSCNPYLCDGVDDGCPTSCDADSDCASGNYCRNGACTGKIANGGSCAAGNECASGFCVDGLCCNSACTGGCNACNVAGSQGTCTILEHGEKGSPECAPYVCDGVGASCPGACDADDDCIGTSYCSASACVAKRANGESCTAANQCLAQACISNRCAYPVAIPTFSEWGLMVLAASLATTMAMALRKRREQSDARRG